MAKQQPGIAKRSTALSTDKNLTTSKKTIDAFLSKIAPSSIWIKPQKKGK